MKKLSVLLLSAVLVAALSGCGGGSKDSAAGDNGSSGAPAQEITIKAKNFEFDQPEYHVKKGQPVKITLVNDQGNHGIEIKEFKVNLNGSKNSATFTPDKTGTFDIRCSVICGSGHATMASKLIVE